MSNRRITSYRVSFYDQFLVVIDWPETAFPRRWLLWDSSFVSPRLLDHGEGDPPAWHFPMGILPPELRLLCFTPRGER